MRTKRQYTYAHIIAERNQVAIAKKNRKRAKESWDKMAQTAAFVNNQLGNG